MGVVTAAMLERMGCKGRIISLYAQSQPSVDAVSRPSSSSCRKYSPDERNDVIIEPPTGREKKTETYGFICGCVIGSPVKQIEAMRVSREHVKNSTCTPLLAIVLPCIFLSQIVGSVREVVLSERRFLVASSLRRAEENSQNRV